MYLVSHADQRREHQAAIERLRAEHKRLGERMSALDLYLAVMTHWRPGSAWFAANTPKIMAIAARATALPPVGRVVERNFS